MEIQGGYEMKIESKVTMLADSTNNVKAMASITIDDSFVVTGIRVVESRNGDMFTAMPSRKTANGEYKDICFPISAEARASINEAILKVYNEKAGQQETDYSDLDLPF